MHRQLVLTKNQLSGTLSPSMFPPSLVGLRLGENNLSGTLPPALSQRLPLVVYVPALPLSPFPSLPSLSSHLSFGRRQGGGL